MAAVEEENSNSDKDTDSDKYMEEWRPIRAHAAHLLAIFIVYIMQHFFNNTADLSTG